MSVPTDEHWLPIPGFPGYEVSDLGRVMSHKSKTPRLLKLHLNNNGYIHAGIYAEAKMCFRTVHGLVALAFIGPRPDGHEVRHLDDDRTNNTLGNLLYGTRDENMQDSIRNGRFDPERKGRCKRDHVLDEENSAKGQRGKRTCRTCLRAANIAA